MSLKDIKNKIQGIDKTYKVTRAMEAVSAVKMRKSQERALTGRSYAIAALSILHRVVGSRDLLYHPLLDNRDVNKIGLIVITSDKGLAGSLNSAVLRKTEEYIKNSGIKKEMFGIITLGRKGYDYFSKRGYVVLDDVKNIEDKVTKEEFSALTKDVVNLFTDHSYDRFLISYSHFKSTFEQKAVVRQVLPLSVKEIEKTVKEITPREGKYSEMNSVGNTHELYTVEPDHETVLNSVLPYLLQVKLYHSLLEAKASEHSARMVAMKNASDKARDLSKELTISFNKARQAQITREVSEIVGGIEAMS